MESSVTIGSEVEPILVEPVSVMACELERVSDAALDGLVLAVPELAGSRAGREPTRRGLEAFLLHHAVSAERKGDAGGA